MKIPASLCNRIFSGIQPSGIPHLGNYFGAIQRWIELSHDRKVLVDGHHVDCDIPVYSVVDVHAYSSIGNKELFGQTLYENILSTTASLLALGLKPDKCILFRQSDVLQHFYLDNVLDSFISSNKLSRMSQFKDKSANTKSISNGLLNYPILQAADILLYKATLVPVGEDQAQHIELTRDIAKSFNYNLGEELFPLPRAVLSESHHAVRIKSLRNPDKKMSKSDADKKSYIKVIDEPDVIVSKCKKALTDMISEVKYDPENRPAVSNLIRLYHLVTGSSFDEIECKFEGVETAGFKLELAGEIIEKFRGAREEYKRLRLERAYLEQVLQLGADKARPIAEETIAQVRYLLGSQRAQE